MKLLLIRSSRSRLYDKLNRAPPLLLSKYPSLKALFIIGQSYTSSKFDAKSKEMTAWVIWMELPGLIAPDAEVPFRGEIVENMQLHFSLFAMIER